MRDAISLEISTFQYISNGSKKTQFGTCLIPQTLSQVSRGESKKRTMNNKHPKTN
jgi:hypothetical protein